RWREEQLRLEQLRTCTTDFKDWTRRLETAVSGTEKLIGELDAHAGRVDAATTLAEEAAHLLAAATSERQNAEKNWGTPLELAGVQPIATQLPTQRQKLETSQTELAALMQRIPLLTAQLKNQETALPQAAATVDEAEQQRDHARQHKEDVEHADMA